MEHPIETAKDENPDISEALPLLGSVFSEMFNDPDKKRLMISAMDSVIVSAQACRKERISTQTRSELDKLGKHLTA